MKKLRTAAIIFLLSLPSIGQAAAPQAKQQMPLDVLRAFFASEGLPSNLDIPQAISAYNTLAEEGDTAKLSSLNELVEARLKESIGNPKIALSRIRPPQVNLAVVVEAMGQKLPNAAAIATDFLSRFNSYTLADNTHALLKDSGQRALRDAREATQRVWSNEPVNSGAASPVVVNDRVAEDDQPLDNRRAMERFWNTSVANSQRIVRTAPAPTAAPAKDTLAESDTSAPTKAGTDPELKVLPPSKSSKPGQPGQ